MNENKEKLHTLIDSMSDIGTLEYLAAFIELFLGKWGGTHNG